MLKLSEVQGMGWLIHVWQGWKKKNKWNVLISLSQRVQSTLKNTHTVKTLLCSIHRYTLPSEAHCNIVFAKCSINIVYNYYYYTLDRHANKNARQKRERRGTKNITKCTEHLFSQEEVEDVFQNTVIWFQGWFIGWCIMVGCTALSCWYSTSLKSSWFMNTQTL